MIKEWIESYKPKTLEEVNQALREIMQEIALAGLQRAGFFEKAAFYGGTALRIFHGLDRFSEDLDFSLLKKEDSFSMEPYLDQVATEFESLGISVRITEKTKSHDTHIDSAFLKADTLWTELKLESILPELHVTKGVSVKIKIEIDTAPPSGFLTEEKLLINPYSFYVRCYQLPDLFAGKLHALLFRKWKLRVKGRDWYDLEWYIRKGIPLNKEHFIRRSIDSGDIDNALIVNEDVIKLLQNKIESTPLAAVREDVVRFIPDSSKLTLWSKQYFKDLANHIRFA